MKKIKLVENRSFAYSLHHPRTSFGIDPYKTAVDEKGYFIASREMICLVFVFQSELSQYKTGCLIIKRVAA